MARSAQDKFNEFLSDSRETSAAVNQFVSAAYDNTQGYAYGAGYLESVVKDLINELPKARRVALRLQFLSKAQSLRDSMVVDASAV